MFGSVGGLDFVTLQPATLVAQFHPGFPWHLKRECLQRVYFCISPYAAFCLLTCTASKTWEFHHRPALQLAFTVGLERDILLLFPQIYVFPSILEVIFLAFSLSILLPFLSFYPYFFIWLISCFCSCWCLFPPKIYLIKALLLGLSQSFSLIIWFFSFFQPRGLG